MPSEQPEFHVFDTTLRDGAQREGITYSVADKLAVARLLDELGVGFIEGGWPGAMPKDTEFFRRAQTELDLKHATLVAFGATRKAGVAVDDDAQVRGLLESGAPTLCLVAKADVRHVTRALRTTYQENLAMVADTVSYGVAQGRQVFLDCEHFFDGFRADPEYATNVVRAGFEAGADVVVLCDTNGGMLPSRVTQIVTELRERLAAAGLAAPRLGMHAQNDTGCAVANTIAAVEAGAMHVQGTANGYGERPGNADIFTVIGNLELKLGMSVVPDGCLEQMAAVSHAIAEIANLAPDTHQAYVGLSAFAHKAGLHASAIKVDPELYNHVAPAAVGNDMRILVTEMAGRASVELKSRELGVDLAGHPQALARVTERVKELEAGGWSFEAADASFELLARAELGDAGVARPFTLESWRVIVEHREDGAVVSEATVKVRVRGERVIATAEGNGPVNALDSALRQALVRHYPQLGDVELVDYKVRILEGSHGTGAVTRVLVESREGAGGLDAPRSGRGVCADSHREWTTVGVHENVVQASWHALVDALTYAVMRAADTQSALR